MKFSCTICFWQSSCSPDHLGSEVLLFMKLWIGGKRLIALFIILNFLDISTTYILLNSEFGTELNPFMQLVFSEFGFIGGTVLKSIGVLVICLYMYRYMLLGLEGKKGYAFTINSLLTLYFLVVINNLFGIFVLWYYYLYFT